MKFCQVDEPGLVEVDEAASFGFSGVDLAVQAGEFGAQELVVGDRGGYRDGLFTGEELVWLGERGSDVVEDGLDEGGGADVAFGAAALLPTGAQWVVVAALVVAVPGAVAAAHLVAVGFPRRRHRI